MDVKNYAGLFEKVLNKMLRRIALSRYMFFLTLALSIIYI